MAERRSGLPRDELTVSTCCPHAVARRSDPTIPSASASVPGQVPWRHRRPTGPQDAGAYRFRWWDRLGRWDRFGWRDRSGWRHRFGWRDRLRWPRSGQERRLSFGRRGQPSSVVVCRVVRALAKDREPNPGPRGHGTAGLASRDLAQHRSEAQVGDGSLEEPNAAAGRLVVGRVARLGASESQGVRHRVGVVTRYACERERVVGHVEVAAGASQLEAALPHALRDLQPPAVR